MSSLGKKITPEESLSHRSQALNQAGEDSPNDHPFQIRSPQITLDDLILPEETRRRLGLLLSLVEHHDVLYSEWGLAKIDPDGKHLGINLYGEPGTGKTRCAEALASALGKPLIDVSYTEIESKYVGETGKNIVAAFDAATQEDAVLFFDEADSILGQRMTNVTQAADHGVNVARAIMLKQLDAYQGVVIFATNLARNFDSAFVRRIPQHVEIPLPDQAGREALFKLMISKNIPGQSKLDWNLLASRSDGLSGGDIKNAVVAALTSAVSRTGPNRLVRTDDVVLALQDVAHAKTRVGSQSLINKEERSLQEMTEIPSEEIDAQTT